MPKEPMVSRNIRVPAKLWDDAKTAADSSSDETISDVIRRLLTQYVKDNQS